MDRHPSDVTTDEEIDAAFERAKAFDSFPTIVEAEFCPGPKLNFLSLRLSDGQRMLIPKEMLGELKNATVEQATDVKIALLGLSVWWPQLDDGLYLPDFLEHRWGKELRGLAA
ncbi:MAG: DUF2442 domain-containing protein [Acidobacteriota bacterium]|nr:DUF2442 domain-containing protein [Acidobacteriota bacterium]